LRLRPVWSRQVYEPQIRARLGTTAHFTWSLRERPVWILPPTGCVYVCVCVRERERGRERERVCVRVCVCVCPPGRCGSGPCGACRPPRPPAPSAAARSPCGCPVRLSRESLWSIYVPTVFGPSMYQFGPSMSLRYLVHLCPYGSPMSLRYFLPWGPMDYSTSSVSHRSFAVWMSCAVVPRRALRLIDFVSARI